MNRLLQIPYSIREPAANMAVDMGLLAHVSASRDAQWRMYGWSVDAFTFGYSQKWETIDRLRSDPRIDCLRRPTGGGLVDHRRDWTVALAIGSGHPAFRTAALALYREFHLCEAAALGQLGFAVEQAPCAGPCRNRGASARDICFAAPEPYDLMAPATGAKVAGAAMKRNRDGVLIQGSLDAKALKEVCRKEFEQALAKRFAAWLGLTAANARSFEPEEELVKQFASHSWNKRR